MNLQGRDLKQDISGADVRSLQDALTQLGLAIPDAERQQALFGTGTRDVIAAFQKSNNLPSTGVADQATAKLIDQQNAAAAASAWVVSGQVYSGAHAGVGGLGVQVVDKNAGPDVVLAKGVTGVSGAYTVRYSTIELQRRGKTAPDLQTHVYRGDKLLGSSDVRYNATASETLNVQLAADASATLATELESLNAAIAPHYNGALGALQENQTRSDITYLANKSGWDARTIAMAALADQFSQASGTTKVPGSFYYALFRAGVPANPDTLYQLDGNTLQDVWTQAAQQGMIPAVDAATISKTVQQFQAIGAQKLLSSPAITGASTLKDLLTTVQLNADQQTKFAQIYAANRTDSAALWKAVGEGLGADTANRLQVAGKLALLTLNNAPLMQSVQRATGGVKDPLDLIAAGYHLPAQWTMLLAAAVPIPPQIPGDTADAKRANYAQFMAAQLRLSYPTAAIAELANSGQLKLQSAKQVATFLTAQQGKFELGSQPVEQYIRKNNITIDDATLADLKSLQRVHQITTSDTAMAGLLKNNIDAAYRVVQYDRQAFVAKFANDLGGADEALKTYNKSVQLHGAVLNVVISYFTAKNGVPIGNTPFLAQQGGGQIMQPAPTGPTPANANDVIAYPTLEGLFGAMDFCSCEDCRSILSPAAYFVDLLHFIDKAADGKQNAQTVLFGRRPDLPYLPLTCENTNTPMPYIDIVNETMEYYVANGTLAKYQGHDTNGTATEDLMASPQFVLTTAYQTALSQVFPSPLPFHQALESLRAYFEAFGVSLSAAMECLRQTDDLNRGANPYAWEDILMEEIGLSRQEYRLLTDSSLTLGEIYGFGAAKTAQQISDTLSNAKTFARRVDISYDDLVSILKTHFINPNSELIPKLEQLGVSFGAIQALHDAKMTPADFFNLLPTGAGAPDPKEYDNDIVAWLTDAGRYAAIMGIITLTDPTNSTSGCNFGLLELRYAKPVASAADQSTRLSAAEFTRILRFIRLWKKLGWSIEQTDAALCSLFRKDLGPLQAGDVSTLANLDAGFLTLIPRLGVMARVMAALELQTNRDLYSLLACWSDIGTFGDDSLYRTMFVNAAMLKQDPAFAPNGYGEFLSDGSQTIGPHREALRGALNLTGDEYDRILAALKFTDAAPLSLSNVSAIFRRGWLARKLKLSVREFLLLTTLTGIDPFAAPDIGAAPSAEPPVSRLIDLVQALRERSMKSAAALYLIWNQDLSGKSAPDPKQIGEFVRTLRGDFAAIDDQFAAAEDPNGDLLRARMTLVYGQDVSDAFFALLDNKIPIDVPYTNAAPALDPAIVAADSQIAYDNLRHRLSHTGLLTAALQATLKGIAGVSNEFKIAVDAMFALSQDAVASFFSRRPELKAPYDTYVASADPVDVKRTALLNAFQPQLAAQRKREQAIQKLSTAASLDVVSTQTLLDPGSAPFSLHAAEHADQPLLNDVIAVATPGLAANFFFRDTATGAVDATVNAAPNLDYSPTNGNPLPVNPTPGAAISANWTGSIEVPDAGFYNLVVDTDAGATVTLNLDGQAQPMIQNPTSSTTVRWRNANPLQFDGGTLHPMVLTVEKVKAGMTLSWETPKQASGLIPGRYFYPPSVMPPFHDGYIRFLKAASLMAALSITANEIAYFAANADFQIAADGWLNALAATADPDAGTAAALVRPLTALLDYSRIKSTLTPDAPGDEQFLAILKDPATATANPNSALFTLTTWSQTSLNDLLAHFSTNVAGLGHFDTFRRVYAAFDPVQTVGIPAAALIKATTNDPDIAGPIVRDFQSALRARYDSSAWRDLIQPINNGLRSMQRDALVAYILQQMTEAGSTIDTADKLFEFFLMDVQMEPCMQTSRIRHALSSIQLFIDRVVLNLEPDVSPLSINADYWKWMQRYRVWEANREVFLFPENWLDPELRDDKSPFFKEIESVLMQSDITEDTATSALLTYLSKLHDVAKLEPCGMFLDERSSAAEDDVVHVVARSSGARRKYYYRNYELGYWTPWEEIKLDIEDNPIIPVVWDSRLLIFWLRLQKQAPLAPPNPPAPSSTDTKFPDLTLTAVKTDANKNANPNVTVQAVLCWSEYYDGKWQPVKTSDLNAPASLGQFPASGDGSLNRSSVHLRSDEPQDGELRISIYSSGGNAGFLLYNTHSVPVPFIAYPAVGGYGRKRSFEITGPKFTVDYYSAIPDVPPEMLSRDVLTDDTPMNAVQPNHYLSNIWDAPFFFEDRRNAFYVTSTEQQVYIRDHPWFGVSVAPNISAVKIPPLVAQSGPPKAPKYWGDGGPIGPDPVAVDPAPISRFITEDAYIRQGLATTASVTYGDKQIGPSGALDANVPAAGGN